MTNPKSEIVGLAERCEKATGPDREMDALIAAAVHMKQLTYQPDEWIKDPEFTASIDAAMTLVPKNAWLANLQECGLARDRAWAQVDIEVGGAWLTAEGGAATPALALCAAALRARTTLKEQ